MPRASTAAIEQKNATGAVVYWEKGANQSEADAGGVSLADYIHAMFGFLVQAGARDVLMIGCGGGTLATMLRRAGVAVTIADIDARSFAIARAYFALPDDVACHVADGAAFLRRTRRRFDAIVLDAFDGGLIPQQLLTPAFFALAKARLRRRGGLFLVNLIVADDRDRTPDRVARLLGRIWAHARLLDSDGWLDRNAVAAAGAVAALRRPRLLMPPRRGAKKLAASLATLKFRRLRA
ncbi:MAG TPA: fused MFS/spermidine synthase [Rhizomicrobium sp.]|jgi:SAM-dependent methyltransferase|nr:fused MFS/spermidine synthase [Rhizomicrobium sp.]